MVAGCEKGDLGSLGLCEECLKTLTLCVEITDCHSAVSRQLGGENLARTLVGLLSQPYGDIAAHLCSFLNQALALNEEGIVRDLLTQQKQTLERLARRNPAIPAAVELRSKVFPEPNRPDAPKPAPGDLLKEFRLASQSPQKKQAPLGMYRMKVVREIKPSVTRHGVVSAAQFQFRPSVPGNSMLESFKQTQRATLEVPAKPTKSRRLIQVVNVSEEPAERDWKDKLLEMGLQQFSVSFEANGFDNPSVFNQLSDADLKQTGFKRGHIMRWRRMFPSVRDEKQVKARHASAHATAVFGMLESLQPFAEDLQALTAETTVQIHQDYNLVKLLKTVLAFFTGEIEREYFARMRRLCDNVPAQPYKKFDITSINQNDYTMRGYYITHNNFCEYRLKFFKYSYYGRECVGLDCRRMAGNGMTLNAMWHDFLQSLEEEGWIRDDESESEEESSASSGEDTRQFEGAPANFLDLQKYPNVLDRWVHSIERGSTDDQVRALLRLDYHLNLPSNLSILRELDDDKSLTRLLGRQLQDVSHVATVRLACEVLAKLGSARGERSGLADQRTLELVLKCFHNTLPKLTHKARFFSYALEFKKHILEVKQKFIEKFDGVGYDFDFFNDYHENLKLILHHLIVSSNVPQGVSEKSYEMVAQALQNIRKERSKQIASSKLALSKAVYIQEGEAERHVCCLPWDDMRWNPLHARLFALATFAKLDEPRLREKVELVAANWSQGRDFEAVAVKGLAMFKAKLKERRRKNGFRLNDSHVVSSVSGFEAGDYYMVTRNELEFERGDYRVLKDVALAPEDVGKLLGTVVRFIEEGKNDTALVFDGHKEVVIPFAALEALPSGFVLEPLRLMHLDSYASMVEDQVMDHQYDFSDYFNSVNNSLLDICERCRCKVEFTQGPLMMDTLGGCDAQIVHISGIGSSHGLPLEDHADVTGIYEMEQLAGFEACQLLVLALTNTYKHRSGEVPVLDLFPTVPHIVVWLEPPEGDAVVSYEDLNLQSKDATFLQIFYDCLFANQTIQRAYDTAREAVGPAKCTFALHPDDADHGVTLWDIAGGELKTGKGDIAVDSCAAPVNLPEIPPKCKGRVQCEAVHKACNALLSNNCVVVGCPREVKEVDYFDDEEEKQCQFWDVDKLQVARNISFRCARSRWTSGGDVFESKYQDGVICVDLEEGGDVLGLWKDAINNLGIHEPITTDTVESFCVGKRLCFVFRVPSSFGLRELEPIVTGVEAIREGKEDAFFCFVVDKEECSIFSDLEPFEVTIEDEYDTDEEEDTERV